MAARKRRLQAGYPVRTAARLSGLGIDTLRAWERRHRAVAPRRDHRGRLYTENDVRRLRLLREAVARGHSIGRIARLDEVQLARLGTTDGALAAPAESGAVQEPDRSHAIDLTPILNAAARFDAGALDAALGRVAVMLTPLDLLREVVAPLLDQADGAEDAGGKKLAAGPARVVRSSLRNLLGSLLRLHTRATVSGRLLFATTAGERDEIYILGAAVLAASGGLDVIYLGAEVTTDDLLAAATASEADVVALGARGGDEIAAIARTLSRDVELWVVGSGAGRASESIGPRALAISDYEALNRHLIRLR